MRRRLQNRGLLRHLRVDVRRCRWNFLLNRDRVWNCIWNRLRRRLHYRDCIWNRIWCCSRNSLFNRDCIWIRIRRCSWNALLNRDFLDSCRVCHRRSLRMHNRCSLTSCVVINWYAYRSQLRECVRGCLRCCLCHCWHRKRSC